MQRSSDLPFSLMMMKRAMTPDSSRSQQLEIEISAFECPILYTRFRDPVVTVADGYTYERSAILEHFKGGHNSAPLSGLKLYTMRVISNKTLRNAIAEVTSHLGKRRRREADVRGENLGVVPPSFFCPILGRIMRDPVITLADGHSYERSAIEGWLREGIRVSPTTGLDLKNMKLVPNRALRDAILEWVGEHARREEEKDGDDLQVSVMRMKEKIQQLRAGLNTVQDSAPTPSNICQWLLRHTTLPKTRVHEYVHFFLIEGVSCLGELREAAFSDRDLLRLGVDSTHTTQILNALVLFEASISPNPLKGVKLSALTEDQLIAFLCSTIIKGGGVSEYDWGVITFEPEIQPMPTFQLACALACYTLQRYEEQATIVRAGLSAIVTLVNGRNELAHFFVENGGAEAVVSTMQRHLGEKSILIHGCLVVAVLAQSKALTRRLGDAGVCEAVLSAAQSFPKYWPVQVNFCLAVQQLSQEEEICRRLGESGAVEGVLQALKNFGEEVEVLKAGCSAIANLAADDQENAKRLGESGACEAVVGALLRKSKDEGIQRAGCEAILELSWDMDENRRRFECVKACEAVTLAMTQFPNDKAVQHNACGALAGLSHESERKRSVLGRSGACEKVIHAMMNFPLDLGIQVNACKAVERLSLLDGKENARRLGEAGACVAVVTAMNNFKDDDDLQESGCAAVANLSSGEESNRVRLGEAGACEAVLGAMRRFPRVSTLQHFACEAITQLAHADDANRQRLGEAGACESLTAALKYFRADEDLVLVCTEAMGMLCWSNADNCRRLRSCGGCEILIQVMKAFQQEVDIQSNAFTAIRSLADTSTKARALLGELSACEAVLSAMRNFHVDIDFRSMGVSVILSLSQDNKENQLRLGEAGAAEAVVAVMKELAEDARVQHVGCSAIMYLSCVENGEKLRLAGACQAVVQAMKTFPMNLLIQGMGCLAVQYLSEHDDRSRTLLADMEAGQAVLAALKCFADDENMQRAGLGGVVQLSKDPSSSKELYRLGICETLVGIMKRFPLSVQVQRLVCLAMVQLGDRSEEVMRALGEGEATQLLVATMKNFLHDETIQRVVCGAMLKMAAHGRNRIILREAGVAEPLKSLLRTGGQEMVDRLRTAGVFDLMNLLMDEGCTSNAAMEKLFKRGRKGG